MPAQTAKGPAAIAAFLRTRYGGGRDGLRADGLSSMFIDNPLVNLSPDGTSAKARWNALIFHGHDGQAQIEGGIFENDYVLEGGVWKIAAARYFPQFDGPYEEGWVNWGGGDLPIVPHHFTVDTSGIPIPPATGAAPQTKATLAELQQRVDALNDEDRIRSLQSAYGYYEDRKMWDDVVDLFARDGIVEVGGQGVWRGPAGVRRWLESMGPAGLTPRSAQRPGPVRRDRHHRGRRQRGLGAGHRARHARRGGPGKRLVGGRDVPQPLRQGRRRVEDPRDAALPADEDRHLPGLGQEPDRRSPGVGTCPRFLGTHPGDRQAPVGGLPARGEDGRDERAHRGDRRRASRRRSRSRRPGAVSPARPPSTASRTSRPPTATISTTPCPPASAASWRRRGSR